MIISEIILSYPCMKYNVEVSHFTARKSTAVEWVILEAINRCSSLQQYARIAIESFFENIFTITDADLLIRPCLISLQDMGAITVTDIDDETELSTVPMSSLKLTKTGQEMQKQGLLPGVTAEDTFSIYYDVMSKSLLEGAGIYKETPTGLKVFPIDTGQEIDFPMSSVKNWLVQRQKEKKKGHMNWLTPTTKIEDISPIEADLLWKNVLRKIDLGQGLMWRVVGNEDTEIDEASLLKAEFDCPQEYANFPYAQVSNPDEEIDKVVSMSEIHLLVKDNLMKDDIFFVSEKYYVEISSGQLNKKKKMCIGVVFGADEFSVKNENRQMIIRIPDEDLINSGIYFNSKRTIQIGRFDVKAGSKRRDITLAYIPKNSHVDLAGNLVKIVEQYVDRDDSLLFVLWELGLTELFIEYTGRIISKVETLQEKVRVIEDINTRSIRYYNQKLIQASNAERLLINEAYIIGKSKTLQGAREILQEYGGINAFRQNEVLFQKILKLVLKTVGSQKCIDDIWNLWEEIEQIKKTYLGWINKNSLYKMVYSRESIREIINQFEEDSLFEIKEYTSMEQMILNMKRISVRVQEILPEINIFRNYSQENFSEVIRNHIDELNDLYEEVRKWRDEEERIAANITDIGELGGSDSPLIHAASTMRKISGALAIFFDDSFMRYNRVYIADTSILMKEPGLISWFADDKALLVIPMVVLDELDGLKSDEDEEKSYCARQAIRAISNYKTNEWLSTGEASYPELLSEDLDPERNDNKILSTAIKYITKKPVLLTDDINLGNIADAYKIQTMDLNSYQSMKEHEYMNSGKKNGKKNKKKKK